MVAHKVGEGSATLFVPSEADVLEDDAASRGVHHMKSVVGGRGHRLQTPAELDDGLAVFPVPLHFITATVTFCPHW
ncbi:MAG: hypothetical protein ACI9KE_001220 [Polyangiales bacterium]|jgi:hypothetical protein